MIPADISREGLNSPLESLNGPEALDKASLKFISDNIQQLTGEQTVAGYLKTEEKYFGKRSVKSGPVKRTPINAPVRSIAKDGNCLLNAVREGLKLGVSHQSLREEVIQYIDTKGLPFKMELYEYFDACSRINPLFREYSKEALLEALLSNISTASGSKEMISYATTTYLESIKKDKAFLGGSALEVLHRRYQVNLDIRDKDFQKIEQFYHPNFRKNLTLRLKNQHYDIFESSKR
jgi:hypothetical protein